MRNKEVVEGFRDGLMCHSEHLYSEFGKLYSYSTCIAQWVGDRVYLNCTKYSVTTSRHQSLVKSICNPYRIFHDDIPRGIQKLDKYIHEKVHL
jgi:hypothetical protein